MGSRGRPSKAVPASGRRRTGKLEAAPALPGDSVRRKGRAKRVALVSLLVLAVLVIGAAGFVWGHLNDALKTMQADDQTQAAVKEVITEPKAEEPFTMLLLGDDSRAGEAMARSDTMIVARVDPKTKQVWMLSIPRDTRVEIPGHGVEKINTATAYGGPALAIQTVEEFLDVEINGYMTVNFTGFVEMVDSLGGVWIDVETEIDDRKAASHSENASARHIDAGYQLLDGEHALTFVRSRDYVDGDFSRMANQQQFFKALADQVKKIGNATRLPGIIKSMASHMSTTMSASQMVKVALALMDAGSENVYTATVLGEWKSPYVYTDEALKEKLVASMKAGISFDETAPVTQEAVDPADVTVAVRNGAGITGIAASAASVLTGDGFKVTEVGNANQFVYDRTLIVYMESSADGLAMAQAVSASLPIGDLVKSNGMYSFATDILVVVGSDWQTATAGD